MDLPCSALAEKMETSEDKLGFKRALPKERKLREKKVKKGVFAILRKENPTSKSKLPTIEICFSEIFPEIFRMIPPCTKITMRPIKTKLKPIWRGVKPKTSLKKKFIENSIPENPSINRKYMKDKKRVFLFGFLAIKIIGWSISVPARFI